ncbi:ribonuclease HII [Candidatus Parcubacteria bacterium]|nr:MAG: ribonuclease HII [Candidatus Parcubacteria bacterium]
MRRVVIGIDEVGRGALAGPVVLSAVRTEAPVRWVHPKLGPIRDSKKLTARARQLWFDYLTRHPALVWRVSWTSPALIDRVNIARAADRAACRLARRLMPAGACFVWLDGGLRLPADIPHEAVIKGDERIPIVAAASIIAKVWRDRLMVRHAARFPVYGFDEHKGYGTRFHREQLRLHGPSVLHRRSFITRLIEARVRS